MIKTKTATEFAFELRDIQNRWTNRSEGELVVLVTDYLRNTLVSSEKHPVNMSVYGDPEKIRNMLGYKTMFEAIKTNMCRVLEGKVISPYQEGSKPFDGQEFFALVEVYKKLASNARTEDNFKRRQSEFYFSLKRLVARTHGFEQILIKRRHKEKTTTFKLNPKRYELIKDFSIHYGFKSLSQTVSFLLDPNWETQ